MSIISKPSEAGFSLIEVIISAGLLGLIAYVAQTQMLLNMKFNKLNNDRYELIEVAHDIERLIDCSSVPKVCPVSAGTYLDLKSKKGGNLITKDRTSTIKDWRIAAECAPQNTILVRGAKVDKKGAFVKDPLNGKLMDWKDKKGIIFPAGSLCSAALLPPPPQLDLDVGMVSGPACVVTTRSALPCNAAPPPDCNTGYVSSGLSLDTFGGENSQVADEVFGQRWTRYCVQAVPSLPSE